MSWLKNHTDSEKFASLADSALKEGNVNEAENMYKRAAESEEKALSFIDPSKKRTLGITTVSTVALYFKGKDFIKAEHIAHYWLSKGGLPEFAETQLQTILQTIWNDINFY